MTSEGSIALLTKLLAPDDHKSQPVIESILQDPKEGELLWKNILVAIEVANNLSLIGYPIEACVPGGIQGNRVFLFVTGVGYDIQIDSSQMLLRQNYNKGGSKVQCVSTADEMLALWRSEVRG